MVDVVSPCVLIRVGAPVVGLVVVPAALHAAGADAAEQQATQHVGAGTRTRAAGDLAGVLSGEELLGLAQGLVVDDRRVHDLLGEDPLVLVVPAHHGGVAKGDVVDVEQDFVLALAVPDLTAGPFAGSDVRELPCESGALDEPAPPFTPTIQARDFTPGRKRAITGSVVQRPAPCLTLYIAPRRGLVPGSRPR